MISKQKWENFNNQYPQKKLQAQFKNAPKRTSKKTKEAPKKTQMENNRDYNINQRKKKSRKNVQAYCLQKIEGTNTKSPERRTKKSVEPVYRIHHGENIFT
jgi:hypothetical protein